MTKEPAVHPIFPRYFNNVFYFFISKYVNLHLHGVTFIMSCCLWKLRHGPSLVWLHCVYSAQYDLFAVLIHSGNSASSGHYTALIKDPVTRSVYKFNDTLVTKFKDTKFDISKEEENSE